ncbi:UDP-N-acetylmuramate dehydrogenase [Marinicella litoralis]|uniref:UDP-N-acetylenolpyruvoylglucosamine reductase n=1 Tax=Marinicella litoralis TaxID=644220 RepID=A0A4V3DHB5_9GAMM|nr:UDP-N-acetylmuramate dehydrogenase [Marinicella litoralis]TDR17541.1 UDP-N-acetylmuramate dehydrogenase [Marinicella litoralis]
MKIHNDYNLKQLNTLSVDCHCDQFVEINSLADLESLPQDIKITEMLVLGGGSNLLFTQDLNRFVAHIKPRKHITIVDNLVVAWAGTVWNDLVDWAVDRNLGGIENLAAIPGLVGAAPFQNIGAYGVEIKDCLVWVEVYNWHTGLYHRLSNEECLFSYRHSIFKYHDQPWIISRIGLDLRSNAPVNIEYEPLKQRIMGTTKNPSYRQVADEVTRIRAEKLPDPKTLPNAGSFFKNPVINAQQVKRIQRRFKDLPLFDTAQEHEYKTSAAWLLEQSGFKGHKEGDAGFYDKHALILVNHGNATGQDLFRMTKLAKRAVKAKFGIELEDEVRVL